MCLFKCISRPEKERHVYGFTIVELIIVIVVIGILASISIVAYIGVQDQARDAKRTSTIDSYEKLIRIHMARYNSYPRIGDLATCLGEPSHYPASGVFQAGECLYIEDPNWGGRLSGRVDTTHFNPDIYEK